MPDKKKCFIIMPITTPEGMVDKYRDRDKHFSHVLDCLFVPSIEKAGFAPIPPMAKGSDLIQADIIGNLETSDLVLCDMSCLNPNVFFEFGIRTSLNKPVSVVKDELTEKVPFDTGILNYQEYKSSLNSWELQAEVTKLAEHVRVSGERSKGQNTLWRYFGMKSKAEAYKQKPVRRKNSITSPSRWTRFAISLVPWKSAGEHRALKPTVNKTHLTRLLKSSCRTLPVLWDLSMCSGSSPTQ